MTQKELHEGLGVIFNKMLKDVNDNKYNEKMIHTAKTMCGVAKQMIQSADVSIRASKVLNDKKILKELFVEQDA